MAKKMQKVVLFITYEDEVYSPPSDWDWNMIILEESPDENVSAEMIDYSNIIDYNEQS